MALGLNKDALLPRFVSIISKSSSIGGNNSGGLGAAKWIASSNHHTAVVNSEGQLLVCGSNLHGKLGLEGITKTHINRF